MSSKKYITFESIENKLATVADSVATIDKVSNDSISYAEKKNKTVLGIIIGIIAVICVIFLIVLTQIILPQMAYEAEQKELNDAYQKAQQLLDEGEYYEASATFAQLGDYKDSADKTKECINTGLKKSKKGDTVLFGHYEYNGEAVYREWIVLKKDGSKRLLLQKNGYETETYYQYDDYYLQPGNSQIYWDQSMIRGYLNHKYIMDSFDKEDMKKLDKSKSPTDDYVFLLSKDELKEYVPKKVRKMKIATSNDEYPNWWLRTPGPRETGEMPEQLAVDEEGKVYSSYDMADHLWVRPAIWIDTSTKGEIKSTKQFEKRGKIVTLHDISYDDGGDSGVYMFVGESISKYDKHISIGVTYEDGTTGEEKCSEKTGLYIENPGTIHADDNLITVRDSNSDLHFTERFVGVD